ncbi:MAG: hypothetical protein IJA83_12010, partial [Clostridia bacterium]|nr:hypothetical protein [Clostridia bacterium]
MVVLVPVAAQTEEDQMSYANAAGTKDYRVTVEDPWPIAQYQPLGGAGEIIRPGGAITTVTKTAELPEDEGQSESSAQLATQTLVAPVEDADGYQWQMQIKLYNSYVQRWSDIKDATDAEMVMSPELLKAVMGEGYTYD